jgi:hypothetical protein
MPEQLNQGLKLALQTFDNGDYAKVIELVSSAKLGSDDIVDKIPRRRILT